MIPRIHPSGCFIRTWPLRKNWSLSSARRSLCNLPRPQGEKKAAVVKMLKASGARFLLLFRTGGSSSIIRNARKLHFVHSELEPISRKLREKRVKSKAQLRKFSLSSSFRKNFVKSRQLILNYNVSCFHGNFFQVRLNFHNILYRFSVKSILSK